MQTVARTDWYYTGRIIFSVGRYTSFGKRNNRSLDFLFKSEKYVLPFCSFTSEGEMEGEHRKRKQTRKTEPKN